MLRFFNIIFLLVIGYSSTSLNQENDAALYFPLNIGNTWQYRVEYYDYVLGTHETSFIAVTVLKDTVLANGKSYYYLTGFGDLLFHREPGLMRFDTLTAKIFQSCSLLESRNEQCQNDEISFYNFGLADSTTTFYYCEDSSSCYAEYYVGFGQVGDLADSSDFKSFWFFPGVAVNRTFSKNFGISTWSIGEGGQSADAFLVYALVNGKEYGNYITSVRGVENYSRFILLPNYPNPFNPSTTIRFALPRREYISLHIIDLLGRHVRTLVENRMEAGEHSIMWDGRDARGTEAAAGIYFAQLRAGEETRRLKLLLVR